MTAESLGLHAEPYGTTGNVGENFNRLLGMPAHDPLHTVIREAVQNIADAAKLGRGPEILIRVRRLEQEHVACMRERIFAELPEHKESRDRLSAFLNGAAPVVLEICDFGTTGLGGPTRADRIPLGTIHTDFINFLRNIGTPRDTDHGGGTYGFGKASFYSISNCRTILVDTLVAEAPFERRFIGCHVGSRFERQDRDGMMSQFTGRHWWGICDPEDGVADPALGDLAAELARQIGMPGRGAGGTGESGTSIMILDPALEDDDLRVVGNRIIEGMLWSFWPRMMREAPDSRKFACRIIVESEELSIPAPEDFPPLDLFCKAMVAARNGTGSDVRTIACRRPIKDLGTLAFEKGLRAPRHTLVEEGSLFEDDGPSCHIALMRPVELVVKYLPGRPLPDSRFEWVGVFVASDDDEVESAFALAEPPAHDDWIPGNLPKGRTRTFVKVALDRLAEAAESMGGLGSSQPTSVSNAPPLARVAGRLGAALVGVAGDGAGQQSRRTTTRGSGGRKARATRPLFERLLRTDDGITIGVFSTQIHQDRQRSGRLLRATAAIAMEGAAVRRLDASIASPEIVCIRAQDGTRTAKCGEIELDGAEGLYEIHVSIPADCAVTVEAVLETGRIG